MITGAVVLYDSPKQNIERVIESFAPSEDRLLFLIDNSKKSTDVYNERPFIFYIHNDKNLGYGAANNIGIKMAIERKASYHVIMNPDVVFLPSIIEKLKDYADRNADAVDIMPRVFSPEGEEQYLAKLLPTPLDVFVRRFMPGTGLAKKLDVQYSLRNVDHGAIINAPFLSGCFMFLRVDTLSNYTLFFDEHFFLYFEDCDFSRRLHRVGKTIFYPGVSIIHYHKRDSYRNHKCFR